MRQRAAIAVEILIGEPALADRIAGIVAAQPDLRVIDPDDPDDADVTILDALPDGESRNATIVIADRLDPIVALRAGAAGILRPAATATQVMLAIRGAMAGLAVVPRDTLAEWPDEALDEPDVGKSSLPILTARELEVLGLVASGASNKMIARDLDISIHTVKFHVASILTKLDATGRTDAVAQAARLGLLML